MPWKLGSKVISMCIVPASIKYAIATHNTQIATYAMPDNCRQGSFVYEVALKQIGVKGAKTTLSLNTLYEERSENTSAIVVLQVRLQRLYASKDLPVDKQEIKTPEKITK